MTLVTKVLLLDDRVLVRPDPIDNVDRAEDVGGGATLIKQLAIHKDAPAQGTVLAVGDGRYSANGVLIPMRIKVGDVVAYGRYSGQATVIEGEDLFMFREPDITWIRG